MKKRHTGQTCDKCGGELVYWVDIDSRSESDIVCDKCPTEYERLEAERDKLKAQLDAVRDVWDRVRCCITAGPQNEVWKMVAIIDEALDNTLQPDSGKGEG